MLEVSSVAEHLKFKCFHKDFSKEIIILSFADSTSLADVWSNTEAQLNNT